MNLTVDGLDVLYRDWWYYRVPGDTKETILPAPDITNFNSDTAILTWLNVNNRDVFSAQLKQVIAQPEASGSTLINTLTINNISNGPIQIDLFKYADFDVAGASSDEAVLMSANDYISLIDNVTASSINMAEFRAGGNLAYLVTPYTSTDPVPLRTQLSDEAITVFDNTGLPFGPEDFTGGFQWSQTIPKGGALVIENTISSGVSTAPEPAQPLVYIDLIFEDGFETPAP